MSDFLLKWRDQALVLLRQLFRDDRAVIRVLILLVSIDLFFLLVHGVKFAFKEEFIDVFGYWLYRNLTLTNDWAFPEIFNYLKFAVIVFLLFRIFSLVRQPVYLGWAFVYSVALLDDSLQIHEMLGESIGQAFGNMPQLIQGEQGAKEGLRAQDLGELVVYAMYAGSFVLVLGVLDLSK